MPGGGKTLITVSCLEELALQQNKFEFIQLNGMNYRNQKSFINEIFFLLFKKKSLNPCQELITNLQSQKRSTHLSIFIDEFDNLFNSNSQEIFTIFNIISCPNSNISIIGVSNSMEMVFDLSKKYKIILPDMKNIVFEPYSQKEISQILQSRLKEMSSKLNVPESIIDNNALRFCSGKMYNLKGGDIRCLFDVCKKALVQTYSNKTICPQNTLVLKTDQESSQPQVSIPQLQQIIDKLYKVNYKFICEMPIEQQLAILSIYQIHKQQESIIDINLGQLKKSFNQICIGMGICNSGVNTILDILENLQNYQIIKIINKDISQNSAGHNKKQVKQNQDDKISILLKIRTEDIYNALEDQEKFSDFFEQYKNN